MTDDTSYDTTERVDQYEHGARLHIRSKRGTGTRDEDKVSGELHVESVDALEANREHLRNQVVDTLEDLRHTQPDSDLLTRDDQQALANELTDVLDDFGEYPHATRETLQDVIQQLNG
jgi:hypothetical protein